MTVKEFRVIINDPMINENLEIFTRDNVFDPGGVEHIDGITELLDGYNRVIGIVIV